MSNIPKPEDEKNLEFDIRYQPDMVLSGSLDATVPEMNNLQLELGDETYDLLGAQTGDQILELLSEDLTAAEEGKVLTVVGEAEPVVTYYLPEQTITLTTGQGTATGADFSGLSDGDKATLTLTIDGKTTTTEGELYGTAFAFGRSSDIDSTGAVNLSAQDVGFTVLEMSGEKTATLSISATTEGEKTYSAQWAEAQGGGEAVNLDAITTEVQTAAMTAAGNADTSGFFGVSLSMFGNETTVEIANLITEAARAGKISALGQNFTLVSSVIDEEYPPTAAGMEAFTTISFLVPVIALGLNKYYTLAVQIGTADKRDQQTDEYVPTLAVSCWAMKIANYPSNG